MSMDDREDQSFEVSELRDGELVERLDPEQSPQPQAPAVAYRDPLCTFCGYSLLGLRVEEHCPECGKPIWDSNIQPKTSGFSITSMVLGIVGIASCMAYGVPGIILGALAIIFAHMSFKQIQAGERAGSTRGFARTGMICGIVSLTLGLLYATVIVIFIMNL